MNNNKPISLTKCAMEYGLYMSVYLLILFFCFINSKSQIAGTAMLALIFVLPFFLFRLMKQYALQIPRIQTTFSRLWLFGILLMIFASIPAGLVQYIYHQYINPGWLGEQIDALKTTLATLENTNSFAADMNQQLSTIVWPNAIQLAIQYMWLTTFLGTFVSLLVTPFVIFSRRRKPDTGF